MNRTRDVVDGKRCFDQPVGFGVIHVDRSRVGEFSQPGAVFIELRQQTFGSNGHRDHLAALFGCADGKDFNARGGLSQHAHVAIDICGIRQLARRSRNVAEHSFRCRHRR